MNYQRTKAGTLYVEVPIGDEGAPFAKLRFSAHTIRRERTGVHANVGIWFDSNQLEYDTFNVERNEERRRLAKGSWNLLPNDERGVRNWIPLENLKADLDLFCEGLWAAHVGRVEVEPMRAETFHPRRMLGPYLVEEGGTILYGNPGGGKSWIAYLLAQSMNSGSPVVWPSVKKGHRPLLVNLERSRKDVESRLWTINRTLGINGTEHPLDTINGRGMSLRDVEGAALRHIEKHGNDILFLDSISRIGGGSMNKDDVANEAMDMLNRLCPTWFAIAHQAKGGTDPVSGEKREASTFGCYSSDTEVLTGRGWVLHQDLHDNDRVATFVPETGMLRWDRIVAQHRYDYAGKMLRIGGQSQDILVTPNHRMLVRNGTRVAGAPAWQKDWHFAEAADLKSNNRLPYASPWEGDCEDATEIAINGFSFPADAFCTYLGWWISEGSVNAGKYPVITQAQGDLADRMVEIVAQLGLPYFVGRYENYGYPGKEHELPIQHLALRGCSWLATWLKHEAGPLAPSKRIPEIVWALSSRQKRLVFDALMEGDGSWDWRRPDQTAKRGGAGGSGRYDTTSPALADDMQRLAIELGYSAMIRSNAGALPHHHRKYTVLIGNRKYIGVCRRYGHVREEDYEGQVYCLTVPSGAYLTRRNGKMAIAGNSVMYAAACDMEVGLTSDATPSRIVVDLYVRKKNVAVVSSHETLYLDMDTKGLMEVLRPDDWDRYRKTE